MRARVSWSKVSQLGMNSSPASTANAKTHLPFFNGITSLAQRYFLNRPLSPFH
jgi:hypothetical protein